MRRSPRLHGLWLFLLVGAACSGSGGPGTTLGGSQSPIGEANTTFAIANIPGFSSFDAKIGELTGGVSKIVVSCTVADSAMLDIARAIPGTQVSGNTVTGGGKARITSEGIANVYDEGELVLIKFDAKVGDTYTLTRGSSTITRTVTAVSTTDDFPWNNMLIKTDTVEEKGRNLPGVSKIEYRTNHRFGLVAIKAYFEDGTSKSVNIIGSKTN